jgi:hypothetical protein
MRLPFAQSNAALRKTASPPNVAGISNFGSDLERCISCYPHMGAQK